VRVWVSKNGEKKKEDEEERGGRSAKRNNGISGGFSFETKTLSWMKDSPLFCRTRKNIFRLGRMMVAGFSAGLH